MPDGQRNGDSHEALNRHYGKQVIGRSLRHFLMGKGVKFFATLAALLILARWMETAQYGAYIALRGISLIFDALTRFGIAQVLYRYLPELRATGNSKSAYSLLRNGLLLRAATIALGMLAVLPFMEQLGVVFKLSDWIWVLPFVLVVGGLEFLATTFAQSLESFMWQKEAQFSLAAGNVLKVILFVPLVLFEELTLVHVYLVEGACWIFVILSLSRGLLAQWRSDEHREDGSAGWLRDNLRRVLRFGAWAMALSLTAQIYNTGPMRLVGAYYLSIVDLATFGFASHLGDFIRRMQPTTLGATMFRPLLVANYAVSSDFDKAVRMANLMYRFNVALLMIPIGITLIAGEAVLDLVTDGKYGSAAPILVGLLAVLIVAGVRQILELILKAVERNDIQVMGNLLYATSLLVAIVATPVLGAWGIVGANFLGTVLVNMLLVFLLAKAGFRFWLQCRNLLTVVVYAAVAAVFGQFVADLWGGTLIPVLAGAAVFLCGYVGLMWVRPPFDASEQESIRSILKRGKKKGDSGPEVKAPAA